MNPIVGQIEMQWLIDHHWIWNDFIDHTHNEWFEFIGRLIVINACCAKHARTPRVNSEELWEMLV